MYKIAQCSLFESRSISKNAHIALAMGCLLCNNKMPMLRKGHGAQLVGGWKGGTIIQCPFPSVQCPFFAKSSVHLSKLTVSMSNLYMHSSVHFSFSF